MAQSRPGRGVSPIIATILLVAITVVLAAVLYVLVSTLTSGTSGKPPLYIGFAKGTPSQGAAPTFFYSFTVTASVPTSTGTFGLTVSTPGGSGVPGAPTASCGGLFTNCTAPSVAGQWYAVLTNGNGAVVAVYSGAGWTAQVAVPPSGSLVLVSNGSLAGSSDVLSAFGLAGFSVSGSTTL